MRKSVLMASLIFITALAAAAQKKPAVSHHVVDDSGKSGLAENHLAEGVAPTLCQPCLFYGGDLNPADPNADGMSDENTLLIAGGGSSTYASFNVPNSLTAKVTGIFFNLQASANFDPRTASYDIRTGISEGNGGSSIASGTANTVVALTGRSYGGLNEYTVLVRLPVAQILGPGAYWFNVTPACTNGAKDGSCYQGRMYLSNTTQRTNNVRGEAQSIHSMFLNSAFFGSSWVNWCGPTLGFNGSECAGASFGLTGTAENN